MKNPSTPAFFLLIALMLNGFSSSHAQRRAQLPVDTAYVRLYPLHLVGRVYFSQKYTHVDLLPPSGAARLKYRPNTSLNLGVGATYGPFTLNLAYGFGFLNPDAGKGRTRYLDLQSHVYTRQWVIDGFGQFYTGYHLVPRGFATGDPAAYYHRPDARLRFFGASAYRLFNPRRFSYRAALVQNEWQKRSAGSWLVGAEWSAGTFRGDSSLVPGRVVGLYPRPLVREVRFLRLGPGAGYAHTVVFRKNIFVMASLTANLNLSFNHETSEAGQTRAVSLRPNALYRVVAGYSNGRYNANLAWVNSTTAVGSADLAYGYRMRTGNFRLTVARLFVPGKRLRKLRKAVEEKLPLPTP